MTSEKFQEQYKKLNPKQREAVDTIDGPVMVIAGPGTGKTQILALRIANILQKTDTPANGILCLTFTNSGVRAMRERLLNIMGATASRVTISTFHSFGIGLIQEFFEDLSLDEPPTLLDDKDTVVLYDELLEKHDWEYLRPRTGGENNFDDLKSLVSLLKRERMSATEFLEEIEKEQVRIKNDPASISSRGPSKGQMKSVEKEKLERLERTKETARFFELYENTKKERNLADYDDILEYIVKLVKVSEDARASIRERYLYILVDEHQDSSGVQNEFLEEVWGGTEQPNIFVVGDDRQLIYAFGGASLSHFEKFREVFSDTRLIALTENYRSTQTILDASAKLLESSIIKEKLTGNAKEAHPVRLVEAEFPRDEILAAGLEIKKRIEAGLSPDECAVLLPKRSQVKSAVIVLRDLGLPVASGGKSSFFGVPETQSLLLLLRAAADPFNASHLGQILLDPGFGISFLVAHEFLRKNGRRISLATMREAGTEISALGEKIENLAKEVQRKTVYAFIQLATKELFFEKIDSHESLLVQIEVVRTMLHLALSSLEKNSKLALPEFLTFIDRLETYGQDIPLAVFSADEGVKVMTLHGSKGLEFDSVWIAHLDEASLMKGKQMKVTLPESMKEKISVKDEITARRELYVAMTRAKSHLTLSYSHSGYSGGDQFLARIVAEMPQEIFKKTDSAATETVIRAHDPKAYIASDPIIPPEDIRAEIIKLVKGNFAERPVSVTHLNNFWSCPWKWYFRNFLALPEPETESLQFGNLVHGAIEAFLTEADSSKKGISALIESGLDDLHVFDERTRTRFGKDAEKVLANFAAAWLPKLVGALSEQKMKPYRDPDFPEIEITGKIDATLVLPDKSLSVTDFKTGKVKSPREIEKAGENRPLSDLLRQLAMYSYLLEAESDEKKVSFSRLLFLEAEEGDKNASYETQISREQIELLRQDLKEYSQLLGNGKWIDLPCDFKSNGKQKECEYCALAKRLK